VPYRWQWPADRCTCPTPYFLAERLVSHPAAHIHKIPFLSSRVQSLRECSALCLLAPADVVGRSHCARDGECSEKAALAVTILHKASALARSKVCTGFDRDLVEEFSRDGGADPTLSCAAVSPLLVSGRGGVSSIWPAGGPCEVHTILLPPPNVCSSVQIVDSRFWHLNIHLISF
jgi:hypothetical protein